MESNSISWPPACILFYSVWSSPAATSHRYVSGSLRNYCLNGPPFFLWVLMGSLCSSEVRLEVWRFVLAIVVLGSVVNDGWSRWLWRGNCLWGFGLFWGGSTPTTFRTYRMSTLLTDIRQLKLDLDLKFSVRSVDGWLFVRLLTAVFWWSSWHISW